jgi:hypothetical protein
MVMRFSDSHLPIQSVPRALSPEGVRLPFPWALPSRIAIPSYLEGRDWEECGPRLAQEITLNNLKNN